MIFLSLIRRKLEADDLFPIPFQCPKRSWKIEVGVDLQAQQFTININTIPFFLLPYVKKLDNFEEDEKQLGRFEGTIKLNKQLICEGIRSWDF